MTNQTPEEPLERLMREAGLTREAYERIEKWIEENDNDNGCGCGNCVCGANDD
jgi:hypothetical protein